jgi:hypothetical protein
MTKWIKKLLCANKGHISKYLLVRCSGGGGRGTLGSSVSARSHSHESQAYYYQPKAIISSPPWLSLSLCPEHFRYTPDGCYSTCQFSDYNDFVRQEQKYQKNAILLVQHVVILLVCISLSLPNQVHSFYCKQVFGNQNLTKTLATPSVCIYYSVF